MLLMDYYSNVFLYNTQGSLRADRKKETLEHKIILLAPPRGASLKIISLVSLKMSFQLTAQTTCQFSPRLFSQSSIPKIFYAPLNGHTPSRLSLSSPTPFSMMIFFPWSIPSPSISTSGLCSWNSSPSRTYHFAKRSFWIQSTFPRALTIAVFCSSLSLG